MPWFNVDDGFANSKPVLRIPRRYRCAAIGLWTLAGSWSAKELTDGFIPDHTLEEFASTPTMAALLVKADLWTEVAGGWQFNNWAKYQKTKEQVYAYRAAEAERKRKQRAGGKPPGGGGLSHPDTGRTDSGVPLGRGAESGIPEPEPEPEPNHSSLVTSGGGVAKVDARGPRPSCHRHAENSRTTFCGDCARRREWDEAQEADELKQRREANEARLAAIKACTDCDPNGKRELGSNFLTDCTHPNLNREVS